MALFASQSFCVIVEYILKRRNWVEYISRNLIIVVGLHIMVGKFIKLVTLYVFNLPLSIIKLCLEAGMELPNINGKDSLKNIDFNQIFMLINAGVVGKLVEIESADGDIISITVE